MRTQKRNKKPIYLCQRYVDEDTQITKYKEPILIMEHYHTTNSVGDMTAMGMEYTRGLRIKSNNKIFLNGKWVDRSTVYHPGDRVYVYVTPPITHDVFCEDADYEVGGLPIVTPNQFSIDLFNLSGKN